MDQIIAAYKDAWLNWKNFSGRSRRSAYWYVILVNVIIGFVLGILSSFAGIFDVITSLYSLAFLVPSIALAVRRLHDTGHSGWWYLIVLTGIGAIVLLVWFCQDSQPDNKYGPSPKGYGAPAGYGPQPQYGAPYNPQAPQQPQQPQPPQNNNNNNYYNGPEL